MAESDPRLVAFIQDLVPVGAQRETWPSGAALDIKAFLTERVPPLDLVSGVRAILRNGDSILAFEGPAEGTHILPGGRLEEGESPIACLKRELREECGCVAVGEPRYIGFLRFHHVTPRQEGYRYSYPDFLQLLYLADTASDAVERSDEPWVQRPRFVPLSHLDDLPLTPTERGLLKVL
jgi:ADP-ribose pyrophosphatase YjhB (NUDIX family)